MQARDDEALGPIQHLEQRLLLGPRSDEGGAEDVPNILLLQLAEHADLSQHRWLDHGAESGRSALRAPELHLATHPRLASLPAGRRLHILAPLGDRHHGDLARAQGSEVVRDVDGLAARLSRDDLHHGAEVAV
eukprot:9489365-Pyramimonas_sp.AAC.1